MMSVLMSACGQLKKSSKGWDTISNFLERFFYTVSHCLITFIPDFSIYLLMVFSHITPNQLFHSP